MKPQFTPELLAAVKAVASAGKLASNIQKQLVTPALSKGDRSPVTVADYASQAIVAYTLQQQLGDVVLVGEEDTTMLRLDENSVSRKLVAKFVATEISGQDEQATCDLIDFGSQEPTNAFWTIDPIDGTKGFLRGEHYAVALGYIEAGEVQLAALACPKLPDPQQAKLGETGCVLYAIRGEGTWSIPMNDLTAMPTKRTTSTTNNAAEMRLLRSVESAHTNTGTIGNFIEALNIQAASVGMDSQAKYAVLAAGGAEAITRFLSASRPDYREMIWDQAAGSLVVEEAGGTVTDLAGKPLDFSQGRTLANNRGVLATNGPLHTAALEAMKAIGA